TAPARDPPTPRAVDELGVGPFARGHGKDDRLHLADLLLSVDAGRLALERLGAGNHVEDAFEGPHPTKLPDLGQEVVKADLPRAQVLLDLGRLLLVQGPLGALDQAQDVA